MQITLSSLIQIFFDSLYIQRKKNKHENMNINYHDWCLYCG
jgi:hypothetical protein